jgi:hypothetical protein
MSEENDGVVVLSPEAKLIGRIRLPGRCANRGDRQNFRPLPHLRIANRRLRPA